MKGTITRWHSSHQNALNGAGTLIGAPVPSGARRPQSTPLLGLARPRSDVTSGGAHGAGDASNTRYSSATMHNHFSSEHAERARGGRGGRRVGGVIVNGHARSCGGDHREVPLIFFSLCLVVNFVCLFFFSSI